MKLLYNAIGGWKTLVAVALVGIMFYANGTKASADEQLSLADCQRGRTTPRFYACEQAKATRELADTVARIEKKLPDFSK